LFVSVFYLLTSPIPITFDDIITSDYRSRLFNA
jgi:hypothetical protein